MLAIISFFLIFLNSTLFAIGEIETGTLTVTYQTGPNRERLDRVRFLLTDSAHCQRMYPRKKGYVDEMERHTRMVIIEGLPIGEYELSFVLPNQDDFFEEVAPRKVLIEKDKITKVDQIIPVHYASLQAQVQVPVTVKKYPTITLQNESNDICGQSFDGNLHASQLLPGKYTIIFGPLPGYRTPQPILIDLDPGENAGPFIAKYTR